MIALENKDIKLIASVIADLISWSGTFVLFLCSRS